MTTYFNTPSSTRHQMTTQKISRHSTLPGSSGKAHCPCANRPHAFWSGVRLVCVPTKIVAMLELSISNMTLSACKQIHTPIKNVQVLLYAIQELMYPLRRCQSKKVCRRQLMVLAQVSSKLQICLCIISVTLIQLTGIFAKNQQNQT